MFRLDDTKFLKSNMSLYRLYRGVAKTRFTAVFYVTTLYIWLPADAAATKKEKTNMMEEPGVSGGEMDKEDNNNSQSKELKRGNFCGVDVVWF